MPKKHTTMPVYISVSCSRPRTPRLARKPEADRCFRVARLLLLAPPARPRSNRLQAVLQQRARERRWCASAGALVSTRRTWREAVGRHDRRSVGHGRWPPASWTPRVGRADRRGRPSVGLCDRLFTVRRLGQLLPLDLLHRRQWRRLGGGYHLGKKAAATSSASKGGGYLLGKSGGRRGGGFTTVGGGSGAGGASPRARVDHVHVHVRVCVCGVRGLRARRRCVAAG